MAGSEGSAPEAVGCRRKVALEAAGSAPEKGDGGVLQRKHLRHHLACQLAPKVHCLLNQRHDRQLRLRSSRSSLPPPRCATRCAAALQASGAPGVSVASAGAEKAAKAVHRKAWRRRFALPQAQAAPIARGRAPAAERACARTAGARASSSKAAKQGAVRCLCCLVTSVCFGRVCAAPARLGNAAVMCLQRTRGSRAARHVSAGGNTCASAVPRAAAARQARGRTGEASGKAPRHPWWLQRPTSRNGTVRRSNRRSGGGSSRRPSGRSTRQRLHGREAAGSARRAARRGRCGRRARAPLAARRLRVGRKRGTDERRESAAERAQGTASAAQAGAAGSAGSGAASAARVTGRPQAAPVLQQPVANGGRVTAACGKQAGHTRPRCAAARQTASAGSGAANRVRYTAALR